VVAIYAQRWGIEPLFHNLKRWWGVSNLWQQSKAALELWMQIRCAAYALTQLLALAQGGNDHRGALRPVVANSIYRTSRARGFRPEVGAIRDADARWGSAFAVLSRSSISARSGKSSRSRF